MSKLNKRKIKGESKSLPVLSPDARDNQSHAARQSTQNLVRAKRWVDEHES